MVFSGCSSSVVCAVEVEQTCLSKMFHIRVRTEKKGHYRLDPGGEGVKQVTQFSPSIFFGVRNIHGIYTIK